MFPRFRAPETMTAVEQAALLKATAAHAAPRDHALYSMALGTGLRLSELLGLNVGDVSPDGREVRWRDQAGVPVVAVSSASRPVSRSVTGPGLPVPMLRPSRLTTGAIPPIVPVTNASSAVYSSVRL